MELKEKMGVDNKASDIHLTVGRRENENVY